jgi:Ca2+-binding RTX toxin-like protein
MRTTRRTYQAVVLVVTLLTVTWLAVTPVAAVVPNNPPLAEADTYEIAEDGLLEVAAPGVLANDTDPDGDTLQIGRIVTYATNGTVTPQRDGSFTYEPDADFYGTDFWGYKATDGTDLSNASRVTITVSPVNDAPVASADSYSVDEDQHLTVDAPGVLANDTDVEGDPLTAVLDVGPSHGTLVELNADGSFQYEPDPDYHGPDSFGYHANDGSDDSAVVRVAITVDPINDRPVAVADSYTVDEDAVLTVAVPGILGNDSDVDHDPLTARLRVRPAHGTLTAFGGDGSFTYEPDSNYNGPDSFGYSVTDGILNSTTVRVAITVGPVNDAPVGVPDAYRVLEDEVLTVAAPGVLANDTDVDGPALASVLDVAASNGDVTVFNRDGSFTYEPDADFNGIDHFGYHATDGTDDSAMTRVTIAVIAVNDAPVAVADSYRVAENGRLTIGSPGVLANDSDVDGDRISAVLDVRPSHGTITAFAGNGAFTYVPDRGFAGMDSFGYHATDGAEDTATVKVTITVIPDNYAPVAVPDDYRVAINSELAVGAPGVLGNDTDADGDPLEAVLESGPVHGTLTLVADGSFTYTPDKGYQGVDGFRYHATDGLDESNIVEVTIEVLVGCRGEIATIVGTVGDDVIEGTPGDDVIHALEGNDVIRGFGGNDLICGGLGADTIYGGAGDDRIYGCGGDDLLRGGLGDDRLFGGLGDDRLIGGGDDDRLKGGGGDDVLKGRAGNDRVIGGYGGDRMMGNRGDDVLVANDSMEDWLLGGPGFDKARVDSGLDHWKGIERIL